MTRPTLAELAKARASIQAFLASCPTSELAPVLRVMLRATAPLTKEEAIPVMVWNANEMGEWAGSADDSQNAIDALEDDEKGNWAESIRAQWATLVHFFGGAE